jgi:hypothetical protein
MLKRIYQPSLKGNSWNLQARLSVESLISLFVVGLFLAVGCASNSYAQSASGNLLLESSTVSGGLVITVSEDSGTTPVNVVKAVLNYPSNFGTPKVDFTSSPFNIQAENTTSSGTINIARATATSVKGKNLVAKITFSGKTAANANSITINDGQSAIVTSDTNQNILKGSSLQNNSSYQNGQKTTNSSDNQSTQGTSDRPASSRPNQSIIDIIMNFFISLFGGKKQS